MTNKKAKQLKLMKSHFKQQILQPGPRAFSFNFKQIRATYSIYEEGNSVWTDQLFIQKNPKNQKCKLVDKKGNLVSFTSFYKIRVKKKTH